MDLVPGEYLGERFQILEALDESVRSPFYLAADRTNQVALGSLQVLVGLRIFDHMKVPASVLRAEIPVLKRMKHRNLLQVFEIIHETDKSTVTVEHPEAGVLGDLMAQQAFSSAETVHILLQICEAVSCMHRAELVHGALTERAIYISEDLTVKVDTLAREMGNEFTAQTDLRLVGVLGCKLLSGHAYQQKGRLLGKLRNFWELEIAHDSELTEFCQLLAEGKSGLESIRDAGHYFKSLQAGIGLPPMLQGTPVKIVFNGSILLYFLLIANQILFYLFGAFLGYLSR